jgi:hypothetical protein
MIFVLGGSPMADRSFSSEESFSGSTVILHDESGRELSCQIEQIFPLNGQDYFLLLPVDHPIEVFVWRETDDEDEEVLMDAEEEDIEAVFATAKAVLAEQNMVLQHTAIILTATGGLPEVTEDSCISIELDELDEAGEPQTEEFQVLATCFFEDEEYTLCTPLNPLLMFAVQGKDSRFELVAPEEFVMIQSELEEKLFDMLE